MKRYSSFEEINNELAILKLEREIHYQKASLHLKNAKDLLSPEALIRNTFRSITGGYSGIASSIAGFLIMLLLRKMRNWR
jgi:hypothetical protein